MGDEEGYLKRVTKGAFTVFMGMFIGRLLGYLTRIVMARLFGADAYGLFSLASAIVGIATTIALLGIPTGVSRFISYHLGRREWDKARGTILSSLKITVPVGIVASAVVFLAAGDVSVYFFSKPSLTPLVQVFALVIPFSVALTLILHAFRGFQNMKYKVIVDDALRPLSVVSLVVASFFLGYGIFGAVVAYAIGYIVSCAAAIFLLRRLLSEIASEKTVSMSKRLIAFSWPLIISGYLWMLITWTDTMVIGLFWPAKDVGLYNAALTTAGTLIIVIEAFNFIFMPVISELYGKGKRKEIVQVHRSVTKWIFMINLSLFLIMVLFPDNVLGVLFGREFVSASAALIVLAVGYMIRIPGSLIGSALLSKGSTKVNIQLMLIAATGASTNLVLNIMLIPRIGITGAAVSSAVSFTIMMCIRAYLGKRHLGLKIFDASYIKAAIAGVISVSVFYIAIKSFYSSPPWWILGSAFPAFLVMYGFVFLVMKGFDKNDIEVIKSIENRLGFRIDFVRRIVKRFL